MPSEYGKLAVQLSEEKLQKLTARLCNEVRIAKSSRDSVMKDGGFIDFAYSLYEQQSQKGISRDQPRYGGADLTSPIGMENADTLSARAVKTVFLEPLWIVEGIGKSSTQAPVVEEFMQWRQETMRLQKVAKRVFLASFVETGSVFEVCEDAERVVRHECIKAQPLTLEDGSLALDEKGKPQPMLDEEGVPVESADPESFVEVKRTWTDYKRRGAYVRRRSMKDFMFLPSHAEDEREVWGHAHRFWLTMSEIRRREEDGEYTRVDDLGGDTHEREQRQEQERMGVTVEVNHGEDTAEKELWRLQLWADLDGKGLTCYTIVLSEIHETILCIEYDWLQRWRTIYVNPYPCPYSVYGYSLILVKLLTTIEEHTAWRNMNADRGTLKSNAPLKVLHGSTWDPELQPFGAGEVIHVSSQDEVQTFDFDDVSPQAMQQMRDCVADAQRIVGVNDIAIGQLSRTSRTLGENTMATQESFTRTDDPIGNIQEAMEELGEVIHAIEVQTLRDMEKGLDAPSGVAEKIQYHDSSFEGTFTAEMISGTYRFKPRGSTEAADPNRRQQVFINGLNVLQGWAQINPMIAQRMASPQFADALMQMWVTEFKPRDKQAFLAPIQPPQPPMIPGQEQAGMPSPYGAEAGGGGLGGADLVAQLTSQLGGVQ